MASEFITQRRAVAMEQELLRIAREIQIVLAHKDCAPSVADHLEAIQRGISRALR